MPYKLTAQQQVFHDTYRETNNAATAYRRAGYVTERDGVELDWLQAKASQVMNTASMQHALVLSKQVTEQRKQVTADWVQDKLIQAYDQAKLDGDRPNTLRALELIGKTCGAFTENLNISTDQQREYSLEQRLAAKRLSTLLLTSKEHVIDIEALPTEEVK